jgi:NAD+ diphosphatase
MEERVYVFQGGGLVVPEAAGLEAALEGVDPGAVKAAFGALDYRAVPPLESGAQAARGVLLKPDAALPPAWRTLPLREALAQAEKEPSSVLRLYHILQWREDSRFCGSCGAPNGDSPDEFARLCPRCGRIEFPRIAPAVITLVTNDRNEALLAHNKKFRANVYSLIAGFAEAGESLEAAVAREIREEVGVEVTDIRYVTSQPWPFPNSLMLGFTARHASGELCCDGVEIAEAGWFSVESVRSGTPQIPSPGSLSRFIIELWLAEEQKGESKEKVNRRQEKS